MRLPGVVGAAVLAVACGGSSAKTPGPVATGPAPTCVVVADHVKSIMRKRDEATDRLREVLLERCERDGWSAEVKTCIATTPSLDKPKRCKDLLTGLQREALDRGIQDAEMGTAKTACHQYVRAVKKLSRCPSYSKDMVDSYVQVAEGYVEDYERAEDREQRKYIIQNCEQMLDSIESMISNCVP